MAFTLTQTVPWGRSFDEYCAMFALSESDLSGRILGCGDGPAAFNAASTRRGVAVISADPLYRFDAASIRARIEETVPVVMAETRRNRHEFVWNAIPDPETLERVRRAAMEEFLADYSAGRAAGRYVDAELPHLPFSDGAFDLALVSHFLFLYSAQFSLDFHIAAVRELLRVARTVRIFPLLELGGIPSRHGDGVLASLRAEGYAVDVVPVGYEFQRGGNRMLRVERVGA